VHQNIVRPAVESDLPGICILGQRFHEAAELPGTFCPGVFWTFCEYLMNEETCCVFVSDQGMIGGHIAPLPWDATHKVANEVFWWSEDGKGTDLIEAYETWAKPLADEIRMAFLTNMRPLATSRVLSGMGYMGTEIGMVKTW